MVIRPRCTDEGNTVEAAAGPIQATANKWMCAQRGGSDWQLIAAILDVLFGAGGHTPNLPSLRQHLQHAYPSRNDYYK